ncbi:uncharacterized protein LOC142336627 [Convolutriloba macropyga]|uniref:uncharacterized protein LOC142336627 n=1 Tax=Convolutriloba macropyga TaxID=536237 RepID=UPI003F52352C
MSDEVVVQFRGQTQTLDIDDLTSDDLKEHFGLEFEVKQLVEVSSGKSILLKKTEKFKAGYTYEIREPPTSGGTKSEKQVKDLSNWLLKNKNTVQNALVASAATYQENPEIYLVNSIIDHNLKSLVVSACGDCSFLIAEELNSNSVYIAFRGTETINDVKEDLKIYQKAASQGLAHGRFHAGFLSRAEMFPLEKVLMSDLVRNKSLILCGHSLGGAIASIVATNILLEKERMKNQHISSVINITFGAPLFGDDSVRNFLIEKNIDSCFYHIVAENDPVPSLLSFTQSISAMKHQVDKQVSQLVSTVSTVAGQAYVEERKQSLMATKESYVGYLSKIEPFLSPALDVACVVYPANAVFLRGVKEGLDMLTKSMDKSTELEVSQKYVPVGNFFFLCDEFLFTKCFESSDVGSITQSLDILKNAKLSSHEPHKVVNYMRMCKYNKCFQPGGYPPDEITYLPFDDGALTVHTCPRTIQEVLIFDPKLHSIELATVKCQDVTQLRLVLIGENLFQIYLPRCSFDLGFPFGVSEKSTVKKISMGDKIEKLVIEQEVNVNELSISDHGSKVKVATQFGFAEGILPRNNIRNIEVQSVSQISKHESISLVVRKSVQRGMALSQLKNKSSLNEPLVSEILNLAAKCLEAQDNQKLLDMFDDKTKNVQFVLSNEQEYKKVRDICDKIEKYMMSPLELNAEKSTLQVISVGALAVLGGSALAYMAGPGLLLVGAIEALNITGVGTAAAFGTLGTGYVANRWLTQAVADQNYIQVLKFIKAELFRVWSERVKDTDPELLQRVSDLSNDDTVYSNEKALLLMYDKNLGIFNFEGSGLENCTDASKQQLLRRIECVEVVHRIRDILASQCFIGIVGLQDSGKTTLLNKIWGFKGSTGLFAHTDVPVMHQISRKVHIIDFPGSNSLDYHAKTFSICGAMNNMIIVLVPFTGDVSDIVSRELAKVYEAMVGSESSRIIICVNKTGMHLMKLREELRNEENPIDFMKERYITKLNEHFTDRKIKMKKEHIFFTDWEAGQEARDFGIEGIDAIKDVIKQHLIELNVISRMAVDELEQAVAPPQEPKS